MTTCKDCIDLLLNYVEGELASDVRARLEQHFSDCGACEDFLKSYKRTPGLCREALGSTIPDDIARKLRKFIRAELEKNPQHE